MGQINQGQAESPSNRTQSPRSSTYEIWEKRFLQDLTGKGKGANTVKNYRTDLGVFKNFLFEEAPSALENLDQAHFSHGLAQSYGEYLAKKYHFENSKRRKAQTIRLFFDYLCACKIFKENPFRHLKAGPKSLHPPGPTEPHQIQKLWKSLRWQSHQLKNPGEGSEENRSTSGGTTGPVQLLNLRNQVIVAMIYYGGIKVSDFARPTLVDHIFLDTNPRMMIIPPKRDPYTVVFPKPMLGLLQEYLALLKKQQRWEQIHFEEFLFNANAHRILSGGLGARGIELIFKQIREELSIHLTPKSLRQACIIRWIQKGIEESQIKEWLGVAPHYSLRPYKRFADNMGTSFELF